MRSICYIPVLGLIIITCNASLSPPNYRRRNFRFPSISLQQKHHHNRRRIWRTKWDNIWIRDGEVSDDISSNINIGGGSIKDTNTQRDIKSIVRGGSTSTTEIKKKKKLYVKQIPRDHASVYFQYNILTYGRVINNTWQVFGQLMKLIYQLI